MDQLLSQIDVSVELRTLIGVAGIVIGTFVFVLVLRRVIFSTIARLTAKTSTTLDDHLLKPARKYSSLLVYLFGLSVLLNFVQNRYSDYVSEQLAQIVNGIIFGLGTVVVALLIISTLSALLRWYRDTIAVRTETTLDDEFIPLLDRSVKIIVVTLAVLIILDHFGVDIKGLVAVLGVGSLAVALASQETLANMIGGFTIMIDRPFRVGDMVRLADERRVIVHEIGIRSTKFLTYDNTLVIVPNAELIKSTVNNITYPRPMVRVVIDVGVGYDSDMDLVRDVMLGVAESFEGVLNEPKPEFYFLNFGDSSLDVSMRCHVARAEDHRQISSEMRMQILERFRAEGIEIPFPQRVVTMVSDNPPTESC